MAGTWEKIIDLVSRGEVRISEHGYDELAADAIHVRDIIDSISTAEAVEVEHGF